MVFVFLFSGVWRTLQPLALAGKPGALC